MNTKFLFVVPLSALLLSVSGLSMAAAGAGGNPYPKVQPDTQGKGASGMGGMMGHGAKGGDTMGSCPMMGGGPRMDSKTSMQMHGEMMRAKRDIKL